MTVQAVFTEANKILGGTSTSSYTLSDINACVTAINENFVDRTFVGNFLKLP